VWVRNFVIESGEGCLLLVPFCDARRTTRTPMASLSLALFEIHHNRTFLSARARSTRMFVTGVEVTVVVKLVAGAAKATANWPVVSPAGSSFWRVHTRSSAAAATAAAAAAATRWSGTLRTR
jgi:hypothetical protein